MNAKEAKKYIELHRKPHGGLDEEGIIDLIIWAYDKGWADGTKDFKEDSNFITKKRKK
jgi:hypothetical protein